MKTKQKHFSSEQDRNDFLISIPVIALAAIFIIYNVNKDPSDPKVVLQDTSIAGQQSIKGVGASINTSQVETSIIDTPQDSNWDYEIYSDDQDTRSNISMSNHRNVHTNISSATGVPDEVVTDSASHSPIVTSPSPTQGERQTTELSPSIKEPADLTIDQDNQETTLSESSISVPEQSDTPPLEIARTNESIVVNYDCSIAVGLYKKDSNLQRMLQNLTDGGYQPYTVALRRSTKVAIKIPCDQDTSLRILEEIRSGYAQDAFIE